MAVNYEKRAKFFMSPPVAVCMGLLFSAFLQAIQGHVPFSSQRLLLVGLVVGIGFAVLNLNTQKKNQQRMQGDLSDSLYWRLVTAYRSGMLPNDAETRHALPAFLDAREAQIRKGSNSPWILVAFGIFAAFDAFATDSILMKVLAGLILVESAVFYWQRQRALGIIERLRTQLRQKS